MRGSQSQAMRVCCCQTPAGMCFRRMRVSPEASRCSHWEAWDATRTTCGRRAMTWVRGAEVQKKEGPHRVLKVQPDERMNCNVQQLGQDM